MVCCVFSERFATHDYQIILYHICVPEDIGWRAGSRVVDVLMDLWLKAVVLEQVPSPSYWKTLSVLSHRWRHHVSAADDSYTLHYLSHSYVLSIDHTITYSLLHLKHSHVWHA